MVGGSTTYGPSAGLLRMWQLLRNTVVFDCLLVGIGNAVDVSRAHVRLVVSSCFLYPLLIRRNPCLFLSYRWHICTGMFLAGGP